MFAPRHRDSLHAKGHAEPLCSTQLTFGRRSRVSTRRNKFECLLQRKHQQTPLVLWQEPFYIDFESFWPEEPQTSSKDAKFYTSMSADISQTCNSTRITLFLARRHRRHGGYSLPQHFGHVRRQWPQTRHIKVCHPQTSADTGNLHFFNLSTVQRLFRFCSPQAPPSFPQKPGTASAPLKLSPAIRFPKKCQAKIIFNHLLQRYISGTKCICFHCTRSYHALVHSSQEAGSKHRPLIFGCSTALSPELSAHPAPVCP